MGVEQYDEWHEQCHLDDDGIGSPWHDMAIEHMPSLSGKAVLEVACGRGQFAQWLTEQGAEVTAADFSPAAVEIARRVAPLAAIEVADIQALPWPDEHFDVVVSQETLEHLPSPEQGLRELIRVLKRDGTLILTGPNYLSLMGLARGLLRLEGKRYSELGQPINQPLTLIGQWRRVRALGLEVEVVDSVNQLFPIPRWRMVRIQVLEHPHRLMRWFNYNTLIRARKR